MKPTLVDLYEAQLNSSGGSLRLSERHLSKRIAVGAGDQPK
jgi:hypothetical protein